MRRRNITKRHSKSTGKRGNSRLVAIVSQNIKKYRALTGMKQNDLAKAISVSQAAISNLEAGKRGCSLETLEKIAIALGIQAAALLMQPDQN